MAVVKLQGESEKRRGIYYQVESSSTPIGAGGMGQVFQGLCVNEITGATRPVAIKFMFDDLPPQAIERARREASIQLHNDNLIEMLGFIETCEKGPLGKEIKRYHVVSELLSGVSLYNLLKGKATDQYGQENAFAVKLLQEFRTAPECFAKKIVTSVLSGLMALHDAGYIHRDIDPTNIMITDDGRIKLIDLGLAKKLAHVDEQNLSIEGKFLGKPEYAAPELVTGDFQHQNYTTDIYSVGILLYQCLTGHTPYQGAYHDVMDQQLHAKLDLSQIENKDLRAIIAKATEKKQASRYQTCYEMRVALDSIKDKEHASKTSKNYIPVLLVAVLLLGIAASFIMMNRHNSVVEPSNPWVEDTTTEQSTQSVTNSGEIAEAVDLGLSVKWASWNIGASKPEDYGFYFSWGETSPKTNYAWSTYKFGNSPSKYNSTDNKKTLEPSDDAAVVLWGDNWRMPTNDEEKELYQKCSWKYTTVNGINGYQVTGPNGNSIFLPAAGLYDGDGNLGLANDRGWYWSSTVYDNSYALGFYLTPSSFTYKNVGHDRCDGHVIRPVYDTKVSDSETPGPKKPEGKDEPKDSKEPKGKDEKKPDPEPVVKTSSYTDMSDSQLEQLSETDDKAQYELGKRLIKRGGSSNVIRAIQLFKKATSQGNAQARSALAQVMGALKQKAANGDSKAIEILESMNH